MDINEVRRLKLLDLYDEFGGPSGLAKVADTSESYLSQITSDKGKRNLGSRLARKIESACGKPSGWFDVLDPDYDFNSPIIKLSKHLKPDRAGNVGIPPWLPQYSQPVGRVQRIRVGGNDLLFGCVPYVKSKHLDAGGDTLVDIEDEEDRFICPVETLEGLVESAVTLVAHRQVGQSMEPRIRDGDTILIDTERKKINDIEDSKIYAFLYGHELQLRRVRKKYDGSLVLCSDNPASADDETVPFAILDQLKVIGRAVWVGGML